MTDFLFHGDTEHSGAMRHELPISIGDPFLLGIVDGRMHVAVNSLERARVEALVFVNAMVPMPGEKANDWGDNTGAGKARTAAARRGGYPAKFDAETYFMHDVPKKLAKEAESHEPEGACEGVAAAAGGIMSAFARGPALPEN